ncbi:unnamed protein product [Rotaria socialis]|uniref:Tetratricopeptide repeat protein n=1 Tax=Rotaria socialis TaxID=392032 RepID=A0A818BPL7_9BILA|nr:unnamed protein product [Rotaria socialis]CAF3420591.1 unnamed protein product [Rotaria socialis]CAF3497872.1 unnamed protein product [Rotaria socialis]CAF3704179.1 unnamed protein product [Rotaria socialis]CAF4300753.1 unnamed protein product [Rotaria socialis]
MGCCKSCLHIDGAQFNSLNLTRVSSSFTQDEIIQLGTFLSEIPDHCQEAIINLPVRQLLTFYQYHLMALYHGLQREWLFAISYEQCLIKGLRALMPTEKDHYIFCNFYGVLSASFLALGEIHTAIEGIQIALAILLKHTLNDHKKISYHYYHLANAYKRIKHCKEAAECFVKAIEIARLSNEIDEEYVDMLETDLRTIK